MRKLIFSILKIIKTRLRNLMGEEKLDAFIMMAVEKNVLFSIDNDDIINMLKTKSDLLSDKLSY